MPQHGRLTDLTVPFAPAPDIESTALLVEYDASQKSLDLFGNNATDSEQEEVDTSLAQTALDKATEAISVLVRRVSAKCEVRRRRRRHGIYGSVTPPPPLSICVVFSRLELHGCQADGSRGALVVELAARAFTAPEVFLPAGGA